MRAFVRLVWLLTGNLTFVLMILIGCGHVQSLSIPGAIKCHLVLTSNTWRWPMTTDSVNLNQTPLISFCVITRFLCLNFTETVYVDEAPMWHTQTLKGASYVWMRDKMALSDDLGWVHVWHVRELVAVTDRSGEQRSHSWGVQIKLRWLIWSGFN